MPSATKKHSAKKATPTRRTASKTESRRVESGSLADLLTRGLPDHSVLDEAGTDRGRRLARELLGVLLLNGLTREDVADLADELPSRDLVEGFEHVVPITQARDNFRDMIDRAQEEPTLLTKHGRPVAAVVSASFYERAIEALENAQDAEAVAAARAEMAAGAPSIPAAKIHSRLAAE
ncbi:type II toxin-antitoxin system Phd/YefM family antitoxin [Kineococcus sp. TBRC 1896]|uniref:Antitoxin n=1 Tax=Kineococcus mangrovi TaxID=1660183 RepID=A0ABV4I4B5_9ACTN